MAAGPSISRGQLLAQYITSPARCPLVQGPQSVPFARALPPHSPQSQPAPMLAPAPTPR
ncbi:hypothetical protein FIBSPDRAFT_960167 [Athelia psychrophila]|uniref:Uncharacterized protein n=1 Tax=Athelia psychrophila TaxID=1759441 RepID=A0A166CPM6_9AGAM|nr:hypothetical protein FIBSPDRAFT_960167 [Fibularhizoctonia sp. CBS 109695]